MASKEQVLAHISNIRETARAAENNSVHNLDNEKLALEAGVQERSDVTKSFLFGKKKKEEKPAPQTAPQTKKNRNKEPTLVQKIVLGANENMAEIAWYSSFYGWALAALLAFQNPAAFIALLVIGWGGPEAWNIISGKEKKEREAKEKEAARRTSLRHGEDPEFDKELVDPKNLGGYGQKYTLRFVAAFARVMAKFIIPPSLIALFVGSRVVEGSILYAGIPLAAWLGGMALSGTLFALGIVALLWLFHRGPPSVHAGNVRRERSRDRNRVVTEKNKQREHE